jgi:hypothetical protein
MQLIIYSRILSIYIYEVPIPFERSKVMKARFLLIGCAMIVFSSGYASADGIHLEHWPVKQNLIGKDNKKSNDISGIACSTSIGFPRNCLVIDDNIQSAQIATIECTKMVFT